MDRLPHELVNHIAGFIGDDDVRTRSALSMTNSTMAGHMASHELRRAQTHAANPNQTMQTIQDTTNSLALAQSSINSVQRVRDRQAGLPPVQQLNLGDN